MMTLAPFNTAWAESGSKLDLHAYYQRGETLAPLPVRRHHDHVAKGFRYVSLATGEDVNKVADGLRYVGVDMGELSKSYLRTGVRPFDVEQYLGQTNQREAEEVVTLKARLAQIEDNKSKKAKA